MMSIRTTSMPGVFVSSSIPSLPFSALSAIIPYCSSTLLRAKMLRMSSSTISAFFPDSSCGDLRQLAQLVLLAPAVAVRAVHDDGNFGGPLGLGEFLEEIHGAHIAQRPVHDDAVEPVLLRGLECLVPASHRRDLD